MGVYVSPGVYVKEKDISDIVPALATSTCALVGASGKGNVDNIVLITNDQQFIAEYGEPDPSSGTYFHYSALAFLEKGNQLYCLRVENGALYGGVNIMSSVSSEANAAFGTGQASTVFAAPSGLTGDVLFQILGANPGVWDNKISVTVTEIKDGTEAEATDQYTFVIKVFFQNEDGVFEEVELFHVSRKTKVDGFGKQLYLEDKINGVSQYIVVSDNIALVDTILPKIQTIQLVLAAGTDGSSLSSGDLVTGWAEFINPSDVDIRLLINGGETAVAVQQQMLTVASTRADCFAILDMPFASTNSIADMLTFRNTTQNFNSSYCGLYSPWVRIYDRFNDKLIFVPPSGYIASQMAFNDFVAQPWSAPAGFTRGVLNVLEVNDIFTEGERDTLYAAGINPIQMFRGEGIVIWGQKTQQKKASALDRVNVRRLLIVIEKSMSISLRQFVFEPNNVTTRFRITALLEEYLGQLSAQGAFQTEGGDDGFHVVCSVDNNTPVVIDANELRVDVFIKPVRAAEFIQLQTIVTNTGASFSELIARGIIF